MSIQKANHICKNTRCTKGIDGEIKKYWACNDCDRLHSYREVACSPECYQEYMKDIFESRNKTININNDTEKVGVESIVQENIIKKVEPIIIEKKKRKSKTINSGDDIVS